MQAEESVSGASDQKELATCEDGHTSSSCEQTVGDAKGGSDRDSSKKDGGKETEGSRKGVRQGSRRGYVKRGGGNEAEGDTVDGRPKGLGAREVTGTHVGVGEEGVKDTLSSSIVDGRGKGEGRGKGDRKGRGVEKGRGGTLEVNATIRRRSGNVGKGGGGTEDGGTVGATTGGKGGGSDDLDAEERKAKSHPPAERGGIGGSGVAGGGGRGGDGGGGGGRGGGGSGGGDRGRERGGDGVRDGVALHKQASATCANSGAIAVALLKWKLSLRGSHTTCADSTPPKPPRF